MSFVNPFKQAVIKRHRLVGGWFRSASPVIAELMANAGYDFLVIDIEHTTVSAALRGCIGRAAPQRLAITSNGSTTRSASSRRSMRSQATCRWMVRPPNVNPRLAVLAEVDDGQRLHARRSTALHHSESGRCTLGDRASLVRTIPSV